MQGSDKTHCSKFNNIAPLRSVASDSEYAVLRSSLAFRSTSLVWVLLGHRFCVGSVMCWIFELVSKGWGDWGKKNRPFLVHPSKGMHSVLTQLKLYQSGIAFWEQKKSLSSPLLLEGLHFALLMADSAYIAMPISGTRLSSPICAIRGH